MSMIEIVLQGGTAAAVTVLIMWNRTLLAQIRDLNKQVEVLTKHLIKEDPTTQG